MPTYVLVSTVDPRITYTRKFNMKLTPTQTFLLNFLPGTMKRFSKTYKLRTCRENPQDDWFWTSLVSDDGSTATHIIRTKDTREMSRTIASETMHVEHDNACPASGSCTRYDMSFLWCSTFLSPILATHIYTGILYASQCTFHVKMCQVRFFKRSKA